MTSQNMRPSRTPQGCESSWLDEATALTPFEVIDTRSAQGRLDQRIKTVTIHDLVLFHGHACDGLLRGAYAMRALADRVFPGQPFDRTNLRVVSKNSPCLGDIAAYLTGARVRYGTHRLDNSLGVGFVVQIISTGATWEVREEPGFFPASIGVWEAALLSDHQFSVEDKAELIAVHETVVWNWVRTALLTSQPSEHYYVRELADEELPPPLHIAQRTDVVNRDTLASKEFANPYEYSSCPSVEVDASQPWVQRYLKGPSL